MLRIDGTNWYNRVTLFLRRNPLANQDYPQNSTESFFFGGGRVLASFKGGKVDIQGAPIQKTWTLLTVDAMAGDSSICVHDDVRDWPIGGLVSTGGERWALMQVQYTDGVFPVSFLMALTLV